MPGHRRILSRCLVLVDFQEIYHSRSFAAKTSCLVMNVRGSALSQATKNVNKTFQNVFFWLKKKRFVLMFLKRSFNVFAETKPSKICLFLVSKSTFLCNVFKTFFKPFCGNQAFENMFYFGFQINVFVVRFLKRYFYVFFKTELLKIRLVLVSKLTFLCNVFKAFF